MRLKLTAAALAAALILNLPPASGDAQDAGPGAVTAPASCTSASWKCAQKRARLADPDLRTDYSLRTERMLLDLPEGDPECATPSSGMPVQ